MCDCMQTMKMERKRDGDRGDEGKAQHREAVKSPRNLICIEMSVSWSPSSLLSFITYNLLPPDPLPSSQSVPKIQATVSVRGDILTHDTTISVKGI